MAEAQPASGTAPWSGRLFADAPVSPLVLAAATAAAVFGLLLLLAFATGDLQQLLRREAPEWRQEEYRFSFVFSLLIGYLPAAQAYALAGSRRTLDALRPALHCSPSQFAELRERAGRFDPRAMRVAGLAGVAVALTVPFLTDLSLDVYDPRGLGLLPLSHRVSLVLLGWMTGRFVHALLVESRRLARVGREFVRVDLLDLSPLAPLARHGLRNALLSTGILSILALSVVDWGARPGLPITLTAGLVLTAGLGAAGLLLPWRGVHQAIREAKRSELLWCQHEIRRRRALLAAGGTREAAGALADAIAYSELVESVREWPFDSGTLVRFVLYVGIPLGSWLGGALVERLLERVLG